MNVIGTRHSLAPARGERGDLLFYDWNSDSRIDHVTTILGNGKMLHPSSAYKILEIRNTSYFNSRMYSHNTSVYFRRINWQSIK